MMRALRLGRGILAEPEGGVAAVEFAIILTVFCVLALGALEFGYDWFVRQVINNASRDGARYGAMYRADATTGNPIAPASLPYGTYTETIQAVVNNELTGVLPAGSWTVTPSGTGYTSGSAGDPLTVQVQFTKNWSLLGDLLHTPNTITVSTTMVIE